MHKNNGFYPFTVASHWPSNTQAMMRAALGKDLLGSRPYPDSELFTTTATTNMTTMSRTLSTLIVAKSTQNSHRFDFEICDPASGHGLIA